MENGSIAASACSLSLKCWSLGGAGRELGGSKLKPTRQFHSSALLLASSEAGMPPRSLASLSPCEDMQRLMCVITPRQCS